MSVQSEMTDLANQVRRLSGETGTLGISAMTTALAGVTAGGGSGVTIQRATGTFTTDSKGNATVNCGFQPDLVYFQFGADKNGFIFSAAIAFAEESRSGTNNVCSWGDALGDNIAFIDINVWQSEQGFYVGINWVTVDWSYIDAVNAQISYTAVKYT